MHRRRFIQSTLAAGAAAPALAVGAVGRSPHAPAVPGRASLTAADDGGRHAPPGRPAGPAIDLHSHWFSEAALGLLGARATRPRVSRAADGHRTLESSLGPLPLGPEWTDIDHRIAHLDQAGIVHQLLSWPTTLNLEPVLSPAEALPLWKTVNDGFAQVLRLHPARFSALAVLSTEDLAWSIAELRRAHEELGLIGAVLPINALASPAGVRYLAPLLAEADRLGSHLYLHTGYGSDQVPGQPAPVARDGDAGLAWTLAALHHFASAFATVTLTDALDAYPRVTLQIAMLGGAGAAALLAEQVRIAPQRFDASGFDARLQRLSLDTGALGQGPAAIAATVRVLGAGRVVFGSDYGPAADIRPVLANVADAGLPPEALAALLSGNARSLLERHGVRLPPVPRETADV